MRRRSSGVCTGRGKRLKFPTIEVEDFPLPLPARVETRPARGTNKASQTAPMSAPDSRPSWLTEVVAEVTAAIATCQSTLTAKIEAVQLDIGLIRQDADKLRSRVTEAEHRIGAAEDELTQNLAAIRTLQSKVKALEYRAEDAENRNRRNNLRIVGLAGGAEGNHPTAFVEDLFRSLLPAARFSPQYVVERAHRVPPKPAPPGGPPRTLILKVLNFRDRDEILRASRALGELRYQNNRLLIFPDYSVETQKMRKSYDQVKAAMRARNIRYSVLFPARLRVQDGESTRFFNSPREASAWLDSLPRDH